MMVFDALPPLAAAGSSSFAVSSSLESPGVFGSSYNVTETIMDGSASVGVRGLYLSVRWVGCGFDLADANAQLTDTYMYVYAIIPQSPSC